jgi:hypothetical protein
MITYNQINVWVIDHEGMKTLITQFSRQDFGALAATIKSLLQDTAVLGKLRYSFGARRTYWQRSPCTSSLRERL